jgi:hypothetical protein
MDELLYREEMMWL